MDSRLLNNFEKNIEDEIKAYEEMEVLYKEKQSALVTGMIDSLLKVDTKILEKAEHIKHLNSNRIETSKYLGNEKLTITEVINKVQNANNEALAKRLAVQKTKLNLLAHSLKLYENTNMELIKHGLTMTGKKLNIITNVFMPHNTQYNSIGKKIERNDAEQICSVIQEA